MGSKIKEIAKRALRSRFSSIKEVTATKFTGDKAEDSKILDGIMEFIYKPSTTEKNRVKAAKHMAVYFGDDPEDITKEYVDNLMKEYASPTKLAEKAADGGPKWFGAKDHSSQVFDEKTLDSLVKKYNANLIKDSKKQQKVNIEYALAILKAIEKRSKFKTVILKKEKGAGGRVGVTFRIDGFVSINQYQSANISIISNPDNTFTLYIGV
jgi:hypothetical protein